MEHAEHLVIDGWRIDAQANRIERDGVEVRLEPRCMELLLSLAERPGEVLARGEIEERVWEGRVVGYEAVSGSIAKIRKAFGDTEKPHRVIETIPKSGYRLVAAVELASSEIPPMPPIVESTLAWSRFLSVVVVLCVVLASLAWWQPWREAARPSVAVLPFKNLSNDPEQEYFADGLTDDLITDLSKLDDLIVISRNSTFTYKGRAVNIRDVGKALGVSHVIEGSVGLQDNRVRINVQLIEVDSDSHAWAERYQGVLDDVFSMRDEILSKIVTALSVRLAGADQDQAARDETGSVEAYQATLRGLGHYRLFTPQDLVDAIPFLEHALSLDPEYARAHAVLGAVYWGIYNNGWAESAGMTYEIAQQMAERHIDAALLKPTPLAYRISARMHEYFGRPDEAMIVMEKAIARYPNDAHVHQGMSALLVNRDHAAEGLAHIEKAIRLDPESDYQWRKGYAQYHLERYEEAAETLRQGTVRNPDFDWNYLLLAAAYGHLGRTADAREALATFNHVRVNKLGKKKPFTLADLQYWSIKTEAGLARLREGMRKAGVPEA